MIDWTYDKYTTIFYPKELLNRKLSIETLLEEFKARAVKNLQFEFRQITNNFRSFFAFSAFH